MITASTLTRRKEDKDYRMKLTAAREPVNLDLVILGKKLSAMRRPAEIGFVVRRSHAEKSSNIDKRHHSSIHDRQSQSH